MSLKPSPRAAAARAVAAVLAGASLDDALAVEDPALVGADRGLLRALAYGVLREHALLAALAAQMIPKPLTAPDVAALVEVGLFQLRTMRVSPHAAVSETVAACDILGKGGHRGLVNAVLRRYGREREALEATLPQDEATRWSYPRWLVDAIARDWGDRTSDVLAAGNEPGPMTLRVNRRRGSVEDYAEALQKAGIESRRVDGVADALVVDRSVGIERLPGFAQGLVSVQDASAQLAADVLDAQAGQRVLDACAAPGGKAAHVLERADVELVAIDRDAQRLARVTQTFARLQLTGQTHAFDAALFADRWNGAPFDRILLDAPCSGTGVIRRHPDIKWLRRETDVAAMASEQLRLLDGLWPLLAPGGVLVYATCSILAAEGEGVVKQFLLKRADARHEPIEGAWGETRRFGRRIAPGGDFDGFYYAKLRRP
ncbi:MAG TPA: 16S rRNA (cytosine(967)-C(5))-methyltransferase RsmB [Nevskiaceae bacterium]|nr:16S rRNA (cytosine(967)-C(5))-methyltransferase RsmB [Nevskiaceae bacterium]